MTDITEALKNGTALPASATAYQPPPQLVQFVQNIMDGVKAGRVTSLGAVLVGPMGEITCPAFGIQALEIFAGAELLHDDIKAVMRGQGKQQGRIIRAG